MRPCCGAVRVPLGEVQEEWLSSFKGQQQLLEVARHFALDRDVFGGSPQCQSLMTVVYGTSSPVQFGNVLRPDQVGSGVGLVAVSCVPSCVCVCVCMCVCRLRRGLLLFCLSQEATGP